MPRAGAAAAMGVARMLVTARRGHRPERRAFRAGGAMHERAVGRLVVAAARRIGRLGTGVERQECGRGRDQGKNGTPHGSMLATSCFNSSTGFPAAG